MAEPVHAALVAGRCETAARRLRLGEEAAGCAELERISDDLSALAARGDTRIAGILPALADLVAAQGRGDFLRVADVLEFVVAPALRR